MCERGRDGQRERVRGGEEKEREGRERKRERKRERERVEERQKEKDAHRQTEWLNTTQSLYYVSRSLEIELGKEGLHLRILTCARKLYRKSIGHKNIGLTNQRFVLLFESQVMWQRITITMVLVPRPIRSALGLDSP